MKRKIATLLAALMLIMCVPFSAFADGTAVEVWDGSVALAFESGNGTEEYPFVIANGAQLALLAQKVNSATKDNAVESEWGSELYACVDEYYELGADIVLNDTSNNNWINSAKKWTPIGTKLIGFGGHFDGKGYEISGLYVDIEDEIVGLFAFVSDKNVGDATVENVSVVDSYVKGTNDVGGIVGIGGYCNIKNCTFDGKAVGMTNVGGIVGKLYGRVSGCKNKGNISGEESVGGIVGLANSISIPWEISQCENVGSAEASVWRVGGIVGYANYDPYNSENVSVISDCFNIGNISFGGSFGSGGIAGALNARTQDATVVRNCYNIGNGVSGSSFSAICDATSNYVKFEYCYYLQHKKELGALTRNVSGNILNTVNLDGVYPLSADDMHSPTAYAGFDFDNIWGMADGYPVLRTTHDHGFIKYVPDEDGHIAICECGEEVPQEHTLGEFEIILEPTCDSEGEKGKKCQFCGDYLEREPVPALECVLGEFEIITEPTCDSEGEKGKKCELCGEYSECETIPALECVLGDVEIITEPTCHSDGEKGRKCELCGEYSEIEVIPSYSCMLGDVDHNGDIDADDYIYLKRVYFGTATLETLIHPETAFERSDVNKDGVIDADDYITLKRVYFGTAKIG